MLLDIDGTLLRGDGVGMRALTRAGGDLFGDGFSGEGVSYAGRLDPLIVGDLLDTNGVAQTAENRKALREAYAAGLGESLGETGMAALPGALELAQALRDTDGVTVGLLTGNFPETGEMKLRSAGFAMGWFEVRVWGDASEKETPHRNDLPAIARAAYAGLRGREIGGSDVVVIGDTPGDVECARFGGHRSVGVTTGRFGADALEAAGADLVVDGLVDTAGLTGWVMGRTGALGGMER